MKKLLLLIPAITLLTVLSTTNFRANAHDDSANIPHIDSHHNFPPTRADIVRHTFEIHVPKNSNPLTQVIIQVPEVVNWSNKTKDLVVTDGNGKKVTPNVSINGKVIVLSFAESIAPNTDLEIDIKNVRRVTLGNGPVYRLLAKLEGSETPIHLGTVGFRLK
ncbi:hypothetical protein NIES593_00685 [Hydrococcus rivularis NIES-593]|uniref:DUF2808 domain-containing protein n=1 Tax=Hydrococcus rivularis NIES-593 TaxID=1921803 RepID=A0A1U7HSW3_9CYAN|nr:DUF2808 domain-containing protein [Hydrococcus rivularis]OKH26614.1 hypothetical protein NIES593_00685 [Hydrococcus rivularis NIES-593]